MHVRSVSQPTDDGPTRFCAGAFDVTESITVCGVSLLGEYEGHPSFKQLVDQGYQVITF